MIILKHILNISESWNIIVIKFKLICPHIVIYLLTAISYHAIGNNISYTLSPPGGYCKASPDQTRRLHNTDVTFFFF